MNTASDYQPETLTRQELDAKSGPVLIEFGDNGCPWCQGAQAYIQSAMAQFGSKVEHLKIEDGKGRPLGRSFGVKLWPTLIFMNHGQIVQRIVRPESAAQIEQALQNLQA